jgi:hypothetical protein
VKFFACLLGCALLFPIKVLAADPFNYDFVNLDYQHQSLDNGSTSKGPGVDVSYTVWNQLQLVGGYARLNTPAPGTDITNNNYYIGIRGESNFTDSTDFYTDILYLNNRADYQATRTTDDGYRLALGMRHLFSRWVEFDLSAGHNSLTQSSNDGSLSLLLNATSWLAVGFNYTHNSVTNNTGSVSLRVYF